jgi:oxygen-independent coproporphyrinogen III oxidase
MTAHQEALILKYTQAGPRYTSYPTVPNWNNHTFDSQIWKNQIAQLSESQLRSEGLSVYIHLPFCESLCTFCACHKRITKNHAVEQPYITALKAEWAQYLNTFGVVPTLNELHLGGGTPSFFSPAHLADLVSFILRSVKLGNNPAFSFEGHPSNTTSEHLGVLHQLGFRRVSFGVQDYDEGVQKAIHRVQSFESVQAVTQAARTLGYTSISHDLVFGLPFQTDGSVADTIYKTLSLKPERIAFYSYAHVPWIKGNGQRGFQDSDLPSAAQKRGLYEVGLDLFEAAGYTEIGMDHFALASDELFLAAKTGTLHRNFMGYTTQPSKILIGLGASAISDIGVAYGQNLKDVLAYQQTCESGSFSIEKGHILGKQDIFVKNQIMNIMCKFATDWSPEGLSLIDAPALLAALQCFEADGLIERFRGGFRVSESGRPFVRNIAMAFDQYLPAEEIRRNLFSQTI